MVHVSTSNLPPESDDIDPLRSVWEALAHNPTLSDFAEIHPGIEFPVSTDRCVMDEELPGFVPGIQTTADYFQEYVLTGHQYLCTDPVVTNRFAYQLPWEQPKVLVNHTPLSKGYWHTAGAVEETGLLASHRFYGVWPHLPAAAETVAAVINGPIVNAFLYDHRTSRDTSKHLLEQAPVPVFTPEQTDLLMSLVQDYRKYRREWIAGVRDEAFLKHKCSDLLLEIDALVLDAYNLPGDLQAELLRRFEGVTRPCLPFVFTGYGTDLDRARVTLSEKLRWRVLVHRYQQLVDKDFLAGLLPSEAEEVERLGAEIDAAEASSPDLFLTALHSSDH